jgi:P27 family predicted phage terminase small subunit
MVRKNKLTLVSSTPSNPHAPPSTLGKAGASLWRSIMTEYEISDSGGLAMLAQACAAMDRIGECTATIDRDGPVIRTKAGPKEHPLLKIELSLRSFVVRTLQRLGLDVEPLKPIGRPGVATF